MISELQVGCRTLDMAVIDVNDDVAFKSPYAVREVELGGAPFICLYADVPLGQSQPHEDSASSYCHRNLLNPHRAILAVAGHLPGRRPGTATAEQCNKTRDHRICHLSQGANFPLTLDFNSSRLSLSDASMPVAVRLRAPIRICTRSSVSAMIAFRIEFEVLRANSVSLPENPSLLMARTCH